MAATVVYIDAPDATATSKGVVMPDGVTIAVSDGVIGMMGPRLDMREDAEGNRRLAIVIPEEG